MKNPVTSILDLVGGWFIRRAGLAQILLSLEDIRARFALAEKDVERLAQANREMEQHLHRARILLTGQTILREEWDPEGNLIIRGTRYCKAEAEQIIAAVQIKQAVCRTALVSAVMSQVKGQLEGFMGKPEPERRSRWVPDN